MISSNDNSYIDFVFGNQTTNVTQNDRIVIYHSEQFWKTVNYTTFGQCFTFVPPIWVKALLVRMSKSYKRWPTTFWILYQITDVVLTLKMDSLIYIHHQGQFANPDMNDKVSLKLKQRLYMQITHDVRIFKCCEIFICYIKLYSISIQVIHTYDWPTENGSTCNPTNNVGYDNCIIDVSGIKEWFNVHVSFEDHFQAMDKKFMEKYGCYCPIRTKFPGVKDCPLEKLSLDQKLQAWSKYSITTNRFISFIFKNTQTSWVWKRS